MSKEIKTPQNNSEEVDLGQLFKLIGNMFDRFFRFLGNIFNNIFLSFVWLIFFIKTHIVYLIIALLLGLTYAVIKEKKAEPTFKSTVFIKQNYSTGENLYSSIDYYNSLLSEKDYTTLSEVLNIDSSNTSSILRFQVEPVISDNQRLLEYNRYSKKLDSTVASTLVYEDYLDNVKEHIYAVQQITINSTTNDNFSSVFDGIVNSLNSISFFKREQEKDLRELNNRELAIKNVLIQSDSLQKTYKRVLEKTNQIKQGSETSITIEGPDEENKTKEFDLFKNDFELRKELVTIQREKDNKEFIVELMSNTPKKGFTDNSIKVLDKSISQKIFYSILFPFALLSFLLILKYIKYLEKYRNKL